MTESRVMVFAPSERGGRRVQVDDEILGTAFSLHDLAAFLRRAGLEGVDELDVAESSVIEWYGGGPEEWRGTPWTP
ncbi:hypothetical protein J2Z21_005001 [Streptomyces griseochromogenes]|uniref:Uncharacterized protein n=1 Tax=Streptomyces griseochromogenes TaxID=68214 RepID=A0A1B1AWT2_9ACTN|nr:hypothetical protein [Streptomyces griseochromogenes]ANP51046.1 hypothetical protein AVL59_16710 [Streptomyces griseochromogenes]MBP2052019.1 hypothetical protein [Streptomyces griseochromogenes]